MKVVTTLSVVLAFITITFALSLRRNYHKIKGSFQWCGNASQIVSAFGSILFGFASIVTAFSIYLLQDRTRIDAEMGRTTDLLIRFEQNKSSNFDDYAHSGACMAYIVKLFDEPDFDSYLVSTENNRRSTQRIFSKELIFRQPKLEERAECLQSDSDNAITKSRDDFYKFYKRVILTLNNYESVLFDWDKYTENLPRDLISEQIVYQVCLGPTKELVSGRKDLLKFNEMVSGVANALTRHFGSLPYYLACAPLPSINPKTQLKRQRPTRLPRLPRRCLSQSTPLSRT